MNISIIALTTLVIFNYYTAEVFCIPIAHPQLTRLESSNGGFETALSAGISPTDNDDDCVEAAVNAGVAANDQVGADFKLVGLNTGGIRCKQGKKKSFIY